MSNRMGGARSRKPKVQHRADVKQCVVATQNDERFCSTCGARWSVRDDEFVCPKKRGL